MNNHSTDDTESEQIEQNAGIDMNTDRNGIVYAVIEDGDGPFRDGEVVFCGELPSGGVREIGGMGRKPLKWDCTYEIFQNPADAAEHAAEVNHTASHGWIQDSIAEERSQDTTSDTTQTDSIEEPDT